MRNTKPRSQTCYNILQLAVVSLDTYSNAVCKFYKVHIHVYLDASETHSNLFQGSRGYRHFDRQVPSGIKKKYITYNNTTTPLHFNNETIRSKLLVNIVWYGPELTFVLRNQVNQKFKYN